MCRNQRMRLHQKERGIHGEGNRRCKIITLPIKRAREREGSRNRHSPLHCYFLCGQAIPQGLAGCCRKALCDGISLPTFLCVCYHLRWDEQDSPQRCLHHLHNVYTALYDVQDIIPGRKQGEMDWRKRQEAGGDRLEKEAPDNQYPNGNL